MVCRDVDKGDLAEKYLNGQLDPATQDDFELHILECRDCQHFLEALQAARDDLASHAHEIRSHSSFTRGGLQWAWVGAAALSVIALSLGITRFALHHHGRPQVAQQKPPAPNLPENKIDVRVQEADKLEPRRVPKIESAPSTAVMPIIGGANRAARTRRNTLSVDVADASDNSVNGIRATVTQKARQESQLMRKPDNAQPDLQALADLPLNARSPANVVSPSRGEPAHTEVLQNLDERRTDNLSTRPYLSNTQVNAPPPRHLEVPKSVAKSAKAKTQQIRDPFTLKFQFAMHKVKQKFDRTPYVSGKTIYIFPGEELGINVKGGDGEEIDEISYQRNLEKADVRFKFEVQKLGRQSAMMLTIQSSLDKMLFMEASMLLPGYKDPAKTSIAPVWPHLLGVETWPHPILKLELRDLRLASAPKELSR